MLKISSQSIKKKKIKISKINQLRKKFLKFSYIIYFLFLYFISIYIVKLNYTLKKKKISSAYKFGDLSFSYMRLLTPQTYHDLDSIDNT